MDDPARAPDHWQLGLSVATPSRPNRVTARRLPSPPSIDPRIARAAARVAEQLRLAERYAAGG
jgi:hypothetical protein